MKKPKKAKGPKQLTYKLIESGNEPGLSMYAMLAEIVAGYHEDLAQAVIGLAWNLTWKPDVDGRVQIGKCKKSSDLDRELMDFDFVIVLNREFWQEKLVEDNQRRALLDHELCHGALKFDADGEPVEDERERKVYRTKKHDVEEFTAIIERHGCYKRDLEQFAAALRKSKQGSLLFKDFADEVADEKAHAGLAETKAG